MFYANSDVFDKDKCYWHIVTLCLVSGPIHTLFTSFIARYKCLYKSCIPKYEKQWYLYIDNRNWYAHNVNDDAIRSNKDFQDDVQKSFIYVMKQINVDKMLAHIIKNDNVKAEEIHVLIIE